MRPRETTPANATADQIGPRRPARTPILFPSLPPQWLQSVIEPAADGTCVLEPEAADEVRTDRRSGPG